MPVLTAETADIGTVEDRQFPDPRFSPAKRHDDAPRSISPTRPIARSLATAEMRCWWTHGYTSSHHAAGRNPANGNQPGWWDGLIGPGKAIDTDRLYSRRLKHVGLVLWLDQRRQHRP